MRPQLCPIESANSSVVFIALKRDLRVIYRQTMNKEDLEALRQRYDDALEQLRLSREKYEMTKKERQAISLEVGKEASIVEKLRTDSNALATKLEIESVRCAEEQTSVEKKSTAMTALATQNLHSTGIVPLELFRNCVSEISLEYPLKLPDIIAARCFKLVKSIESKVMM